MKKIFVLIVYCLLSTAYCISQTWQWAKQAGGAQPDHGIGIAVDKSGNCYVTGNYLGAAFFGSDTLAMVGWNDIFIAKYDSNGNILWAKRAGGANGFGYGEAGEAITVDTIGNCYVTGVAFNGGNFDTINIDASSVGNIFIAKYNSNGKCKWAKKAGGFSSRGNIGYGINADNNGNLYVTGYFSGAATFGTYTITTVASDAFIAKYDTSGNCIWVKQANATNGASGSSIISDKNGNCYISGSFNGTIILGSFTLSCSANIGNTFIAKYDSSGNCIWAKSINGASNGASYPLSIGIDSLNNLYLTGDYKDSSIYFDSFQLSNAGGYDSYIAKYSANGNCIWAKQIGGAGNDQVYGITSSITGNNYITGRSYNSIGFNFNGCNFSGTNFFIAKVDSAGNCNWNLETNALGGGYAISSNIAETSLYSTGAFMNTANFGSTTLTSLGQNDVFVAKLNILGTGVPPQSGNRTGFAIYPNPSDGTYTMEISRDLLQSKIFIYDMLGKEIFQTTLSKHATIIDIPELVQGVYVVKLQAPDGKILQKSIVQQ